MFQKHTLKPPRLFGEAKAVLARIIITPAVFYNIYHIYELYRKLFMALWEKKDDFFERTLKGFNEHENLQIGKSINLKRKR